MNMMNYKCPKCGVVVTSPRTVIRPPAVPISPCCNVEMIIEF